MKKNRAQPLSSKTETVISAPISPVAPAIDSTAISARAYELWEQGGSVHGLDQDHWLQAERELRGGFSASAPVVS